MHPVRNTIVAIMLGAVLLPAARAAEAGATAGRAVATREEPARVALVAEGRAGARDLARENARLRAENRALREELRRLRQHGPAVAPPTWSTPRVQPLPNVPTRERVPENWVEREINGIRFYIVPLDGSRPR